jgi:hypothetical protein
MRTRVPVAMRNRVRKLERREKRDLPVGGWPPIMGVDEWEVLASRMQDGLVAASRGDMPEPATPPAPYPPQVRKADDGIAGPEPRTAFDELLAARRKARERTAS